MKVTRPKTSLKPDSSLEALKKNSLRVVREARNTILMENLNISRGSNEPYTTSEKYQKNHFRKNKNYLSSSHSLKKKRDSYLSK